MDGNRAAAVLASPLTALLPTFHDDLALEGLLTALAALHAPPERILVVDGAARTHTARLCQRFGAGYLCAPPGRGVQLRAGVAAALEAEPDTALWVLHADCQPHPHATSAIRAVLAQGAAGGYFRFRFGGEARVMKTLLERCIALRCRFGMVYGDQGLFFTGAEYESSGGFAPQPLFEEVPLVRALKRTGRFVALEVPLTIDPRRWERDGYLRRTLHNRWLALAHACGVAPLRLADWYRGPHERFTTRSRRHRAG